MSLVWTRHVCVCVCVCASCGRGKCIMVCVRYYVVYSSRGTYLPGLSVECKRSPCISISGSVRYTSRQQNDSAFSRNEKKLGVFSKYKTLAFSLSLNWSNGKCGASSGFYTHTHTHTHTHIHTSDLTTPGPPMRAHPLALLLGRSKRPLSELVCCGTGLFCPMTGLFCPITARLPYDRSLLPHDRPLLPQQ